MPDVNSLPPAASSPTTARPPAHTYPDSPNPPSPRQLHHPHRQSPRSHFQRRGSSRLGSFSLNDSAHSTNSSPATASTSASTSMIMADPQHYGHGHARQPSLGELHQALESESEATVNRLLAQIRDQRAQIEHYQALAASQQQQSTSDASTTMPPPATSSRTPSTSRSRPTSMQPFPQPQLRTRPSTSLSRNSSHRSSRYETSYEASPVLSPMAAMPAAVVGLERGPTRDRDEVQFAQVEAASIARENQMLKGRVRELERLVEEARARTEPGQPGT